MPSRPCFGAALSLVLLVALSCAQHTPPEVPPAAAPAAVISPEAAVEPAVEPAGPSLTAGPSVEVEDCRALIRWSTAEPATSVVEWSLKPPPRLLVAGEGLATEHEILLDGLLPKTEYVFRILGEDAAGNRGQLTETASLTTAEPTPFVMVTAPVVTVVDHETVRVAWSVNKISSGSVRLRRTTERERLVHSGGFGTRHEATIDKLEPATEYKFRAESTDACGTSVSSIEARFKTADAPAPPPGAVP